MRKLTGVGRSKLPSVETAFAKSMRMCPRHLPSIQDLLKEDSLVKMVEIVYAAFNLAMLAKQVWRLLSEPDSLCARVLRARYYPNGKLLKARMKSGCLYT